MKYVLIWLCLLPICCTSSLCMADEKERAEEWFEWETEIFHGKLHDEWDGEPTVTDMQLVQKDANMMDHSGIITRQGIILDTNLHISGTYGGNNVETWFVDNFQNHETYWSFLAYIGAHSDAFSLIYFQYDRGEKPSQTVLAVKDALAPYLIEEKEVTRWPGTETRNENNHIYCMRTYRVSFDSLEALEAADSLWDWDYPEYPMDLCFYSHGYAWFASSVHEHWNALYTDKANMIRDLISVGLQVSLTGETDEKDIFFDESLKDVKNNL